MIEYKKSLLWHAKIYLMAGNTQAARRCVKQFKEYRDEHLTKTIRLVA